MAIANPNPDPDPDPEQVRMNSSQCWDVEATRHLFDRFSATELESLTPVGYTCGEYL